MILIYVKLEDESPPMQLTSTWVLCNLKTEEHQDTLFFNFF